MTAVEAALALVPVDVTLSYGSYNGPSVRTWTATKVLYGVLASSCFLCNLSRRLPASGNSRDPIA